MLDEGRTVAGDFEHVLTGIGAGGAKERHQNVVDDLIRFVADMAEVDGKTFRAAERRAGHAGENPVADGDGCRTAQADQRNRASGAGGDGDDSIPLSGHGRVIFNVWPI